MEKANSQYKWLWVFVLIALLINFMAREFLPVVLGMSFNTIVAIHAVLGAVILYFAVLCSRTYFEEEGFMSALSPWLPAAIGLWLCSIWLSI